MGRTAVLFRSRYGASKQYALMLGRKLNAEVVENEGLTPQLLSSFDTLILVGGVYSGKIAGIELFAKYRNDFSDKSLFVFAVGISPDSPENTELLRKHNLRGALEAVPLFYGRGSFDESVLSFIDRNVVTLARKAAAKAKPEKRSPLEKAFVETEKKIQWVDESYLEPLCKLLDSNSW